MAEYDCTFSQAIRRMLQYTMLRGATDLSKRIDLRMNTLVVQLSCNILQETL